MSKTVFDYFESRDFARNSDSLIILGNGPTQPRGLVIAEKQGIDCWAINHAIRNMPITALWNIHGDHIIRGRFWKQSAEKLDYRFVDVPIIMQREYVEFPTSVQFPLAEIVKEFETTYFANTVPYMIALALLMGYKKLLLYGIDYWTELRQESICERPCTEWWLGRANERDINIEIPRESHLMTGFYNPRAMYGYEINPQMGFDEILESVKNGGNDNDESKE